MSVGTSDVKAILDTDLGNTAIQTYISQAGSLAGNDNSQTYLTAHLITVTRDRVADKEEVGDRSVTYSGETGLGLDSTDYGQMAQQFDTEGSLDPAKEASLSISGSWD